MCPVLISADELRNILKQRDQALIERDEARVDRDFADHALKKAQAEAAAMRGFIHRLSSLSAASPSAEQARVMADAMLRSTDSGKAILEREREAQWIIDHADACDFFTQREELDWLKRRDAWPKEGKL